MRATTAAFAALMSSFTLGCGGCTPAEPPSTATLADASSDSASVNDAAVSQGAPPTCDSGSGAAVDGGSNFVGAWTQIRGLPANCPVYVAAAPADSISPLAWKQCKSGRSGCQTLVPDWGDQQHHILEFPGTEPVRAVGGKPTILYKRQVPAALSFVNFDAYITVAQPIDQAPTFAVGTPLVGAGECAFQVGIDDRGIALMAVPPHPQAHYFAPSLWCSPAGLQAVAVSEGALGTSDQIPTQHIGYSLSRVFTELVIANVMDVVDPVSGAVTFVAANGSRANAMNPIPCRDGALVLDLRAPRSIGLAGQDGSYKVLIRPSAAPFEVTWVALDRAVDQIVWVESSGDPATGTTSIIWASSYASDPAAIQPRKIAKLNDAANRAGVGGVANAGMMINTSGDTSALLTRLSDGMGWQIAAEPGEGFVYPVWVDDNEVWLSTGLTSGPNYRAYQSGILRVRRDSLGAATVPPGL